MVPKFWIQTVCTHCQGKRLQQPGWEELSTRRTTSIIRQEKTMLQYMLREFSGTSKKSSFKGFAITATMYIGNYFSRLKIQLFLFVNLAFLQHFWSKFFLGGVKPVPRTACCCQKYHKP